MRSRVVHSITLMVAGLLLAGNCLAQDTPHPPSKGGEDTTQPPSKRGVDTISDIDSIAREFRIDEVTVSARRREEPVIPVQKLSGARLEGLATQSVADAVRYFSGVQIKDYGGVGGLKTVDLRSMGTHHLGVFYDGIEIGNAQNGTVDLGKFSMDNIEEIALYNGQKSEIFQPAKDYGSAGTLYLKTRRPRFSGDKRYNLSITMKAGTFGLANPSILYEQKLTDDIHLSVSGEYTYAHGRYHFRYRKVLPTGVVAWDTTAVRQNGDVQAARAEIGLFGYLPEGKWHIKGYYYQSEKGIPGAIVNNVWKNAQRQWDRNAFVQANYTRRVTKGYDVQLNAKYANDRMRYLNPDTTLMYIDNTFTQQEVYLSMAHRLAIVGVKGLVPHKSLNWDLALSADYQWNYLEGNLKNFVFPQRQTILAAAATQLDWTYIKAQASVLGTLVRDKYHTPLPPTPPGPLWKGELVEGGENTPLPPSEGGVVVNKQKPEFTPAVFLTVHPYLQDLYIRTFYKRIFRMPTFNDLYYTDVGNINLKPEYTTQYDLGAEYTKTREQGVLRMADVKIDGYYNQVKNKIVAIPKGNGQYRWEMRNLGYVEIRGCDVNLSTTLCLNPAAATADQVLLNIAAAYTYQRAQDLTDPNSLSYGGQIAYVPWHSGSATANILWRGLSVNYAFIYVGERYHNEANIPANHEQPWYTHDVSVSYEWDTPRPPTPDTPQPPLEGGVRGQKAKHSPRLYFAMEINNLLNQQYDIILNYPMPGINGKGIVRIIL